MTKEKLKQEAEEKYNERLKQNGIKVEYRNGTYVDGYMDSAEPREKRIEELEEENKVLAQNLEDTEILNKTYEKRFKDLEKENAELKEKLKPENCIEYLARGGYVKFLCENGNEHEQLTKAKEIISEYIRLANLEKEDTIAIWQLYHKAEQFLNCSEKPNN